MSKRRLTERQKQRIQAIQERRLERATKKADRKSADTAGDLGPELAGMVISHHGASVVVESPAGDLHRCVVRQNLGSLVCGDRVVWQLGADGDGVVVALEPRQSLLSRPYPDGRSKPVAANINRIAVVAAVAPEPSEFLIDRYLVAAEATGIEPFIILNKTDMLDQDQRHALNARLRVYGEIGYTVLHTSVKAEHGLDALLAQLRNHTSILVGQSGVGKSSLVKALLPDRDIRIGKLSEAEHGRHTTTTSVLYHLPNGGDLIDSPGVRDFGVWHLSNDAVAQGFVEFRPYLGHCKFSDCAHRDEPGCALHEAVEAGHIDRRRFESYHRIMDALRDVRTG